MTGNLLLITAIISGIIGLFWRSRRIYSIHSFAIISSCLLLLYAFIISDFSIQNVLFYSSTKKPLIYKIAGIWANSDASLLFLISLFSVMGFASVISEKNKEVASLNAKILGFISLCTVAYIYFLANPFGIVPNPPQEGMGLNPVLQDVAISIHPPMLYLGYVTIFLPFSYFLSCMIIGNISKAEISRVVLFSRISMFFLTSGISLGSWWAYRELGWGGYWYFDPVENISLLPWLIGLALHHNLIIAEKTGKMLRSSIFLSFTNVSAIIFGIMLVRSGSLVSVHSFATNIKGGIYIVSLFSALVLYLAYVFYKRINVLDKIYRSSFMVKESNIGEKSINLGNIFIYLAAISILISLIYPLVFKITSGVNISLDNNYFHFVFLPLASIISIGSFLMMFIDSSKIKLKLLFPQHQRNAAMMISHLGIFILMIGVILNSCMNQNLEFIGKEGEERIFDNSDVTVALQNVRYAKGPNYYRQIAEFWVKMPSETVILKPENRFYKIENAISAESDIYSYLTKDVYAVLGNVDQDKNLYANIYIRPYMSLIWLGMFMCALGLGISSYSKVSSRMVVSSRT